MRFCAVLLTGLFCAALQAQGVVFSSLPKAMQFFARDNRDSAGVVVAGTVTEAGHDSVSVTVYAGDAVWKQCAAPLAYMDGNARFSMTLTLHAALIQYRMVVKLDSVSVTSVSGIVCGDAYVVEGQSNAVALAASTYQNGFIRSFGSSTTVGTGTGGCFGDTVWGLAQANTTNAHCAVGVWALQLAGRIVETHQVPVCLINQAVSGSEIVWHLRGSGYKTNVTTIYGRLYYRLRKAGLLDKVKAVMWYQGETHSEPTYLNWSADFDTLYRTWKEDFPAIQKVYVFQIHHGCGGTHQDFIRENQRKLQSRYPDVRVVSTMGIPGHDGCHYSEAGYTQLGDNLFRLVGRDFYGSTDTAGISSPDIKQVYFLDSLHRQLAVEFDQPVKWPANLSGNAMKDYFYPDNVPGMVDSGRAEGVRVTLYLKSASSATTLTYLPSLYYNNSTSIYYGPYITNLRDMGALSFMDYPIGVGTARETLKAPLMLSCHAAPNPFSSRITLMVSKSVKSVAVCDVRGIRVLEVNGEALNNNRLVWNAGRLPSGSYTIVAIGINHEKIHQRITLLK